MSRSYRKNLWITSEGKSRAYYKNQANRKIRRSESVPDGGGYKKYYCSWNISDYRFYGKGCDPLWKFRFK